jgi:small subunit ribosomal protein S20
MPNIKSAKKRLLQAEKARLRNRTRLVSTRNMVKRLRKTTDKAVATALLPKVVSMLDKLAKYRIIHRNNAANHKSKLTRFVNRLAA